MATRLLDVADRGVLRAATLANMNWAGQRFTYRDIDEAPDIAHYFSDFPGERDFGLVDVDGETPRSVAWLVYLPAKNPGYGFVDADTPELSITTFEPYRGQRFGTALLKQLL